MAKFQASQFTATEWSTAEDKAKFANHFVRFVESDFKQTLFQKWFYTRLSMCFGHIAHYNQGGFYSTWFTNTRDKISFLQRTKEGGGYGSPHFTYCDVEKVLKAWVVESDLIEKYSAQYRAEVEKEDRAMLAALKAKYEMVAG